MGKVSSQKKTICSSQESRNIQVLGDNFLLPLICVLFIILSHVNPDEESMINNIIGNSLVASLFREK
jgi:hypothetical protein